MSDENESYDGVLEGRLVPGKRPTLILIDMVNAYLAARSPLYCATAAEAVKAAARLLTAARLSAVPVVFTRVTYMPGGANGGLFYKKMPVLNVFDEGSRLGEFPAALQPQEGERVITKQYPSAFFGTDLAELLNGLSVDTAVLGGFSTSGCVRATALDALQHGFAPFVVREACADRHPAPHEANLFDLQAKYAEVVSLDAGLRIICG